MAVILRSNTDLVYLPDHGFVGEEGALRILPQITRQIHRLDISHNLLGSSGTLTLFKGLSTLRLRHSSPELGLGLWGLKEVNLGMNGIDDIALDGLLAYAKKDVLLSRVLVQGNEITLEDGNVESIVNSLNGSHITSFSLVNNTSIRPEGLNRFLGLLDCPSLKSLHLSACNLPPSTSEAIVNYLTSISNSNSTHTSETSSEWKSNSKGEGRGKLRLDQSRCRNLENLELNGNHLGSEGVTKIIDAIEKDNYTITSVGLLANHALSEQITNIDDDQLPGATLDGGDPRLIDRNQENKAIEYQVHQRLPLILDRNRILTRRIRRASVRVLYPARIILNAQVNIHDNSDGDTCVNGVGSMERNKEFARGVIEDISNGVPYKGIFRLLDLPEEIVQLIVRYTSEDPWAFNDAQWTKIRRDAIDRDGLKKMYRSRVVRSRGKMIDEIKGVNREMREEWLKRNNLDKWER
ncbi:uncharacterized protein I303_107003 [Kwoniella dejecticola CBS 10117]|uniref:RNI-like protein n=1 Tax=Kwoniella dejecticola CBS 10117 TaxID=1296121 RepID=A0AAJ8KV04_9TREE